MKYVLLVDKEARATGTFVTILFTHFWFLYQLISLYFIRGAGHWRAFPGWTISLPAGTFYSATTLLQISPALPDTFFMSILDVTNFQRNSKFKSGLWPLRWTAGAVSCWVKLRGHKSTWSTTTQAGDINWTACSFDWQ